MEYRVYLADSGDRFRAAEYFNAPDDVEAEEIAMGLYGHCSSSFFGVELWQGAKRIMRQTRNEAWQTADLRKLIDRRQESLAALEEMMARSHQCVRESQQLMDALSKIRSA